MGFHRKPQTLHIPPVVWEELRRRSQARGLALECLRPTKRLVRSAARASRRRCPHTPHGRSTLILSATVGSAPVYDHCARMCRSPNMPKLPELSDGYGTTSRQHSATIQSCSGTRFSESSHGTRSELIDLIVTVPWIKDTYTLRDDHEYIVGSECGSDGADTDRPRCHSGSQAS